jgi:hypothetical protein
MRERIVFPTGYSVGPIVCRVNKEAIIEGRTGTLLTFGREVASAKSEHWQNPAWAKRSTSGILSGETAHCVFHRRRAMREPPDIGEERLRAWLQDQYDLVPVVLEFLPLGHDYNAGVYHVVSVQGDTYLLKATTRQLYGPSCLVPAYLRDQGITSIVAPAPAKSGALQSFS